MDSMLPAESAILFKLEPVRAILLIFSGVVVSLLAFCARQCNLCLHNYHLKFSTQIKPLSKRGIGIISQNLEFVNCFYIIETNYF